jgi:hypothetical protein
VNEFLKLKINQEKRDSIEADIRKEKDVRARRYKELTAKYICNNRDPRLVIKQGVSA